MQILSCLSQFCAAHRINGNDAPVGCTGIHGHSFLLETEFSSQNATPAHHEKLLTNQNEWIGKNWAGTILLQHNDPLLKALSIIDARAKGMAAMEGKPVQGSISEQVWNGHKPYGMVEQPTLLNMCKEFTGQFITMIPQGMHIVLRSVTIRQAPGYFECTKVTHIINP